MSNKVKILTVFTIAISLSLYLSLSVFAAAGINPQFNYQGKLTNSSGAAVSDAGYNFVFKLYTASSGGSAIWTETWSASTRFTSTVTGTPPISGGTSVTYVNDATESYLAIGDALYNNTASDEVIIESFDTGANTITISPTSKAWASSDSITTKISTKNGLFSARLGSITSLSSINLNQTPLYLGIAVGADSEMTPRKRITSVLQAFQANKLDGILNSTATTAGTEYGSTITVSDTGIVSSGTDTTYGLNISTTRTGATGGTINTYGLYSAVIGDNAGAGTSTAIAGYFSATGADNNYGLWVANGNVGIGATPYSDSIRFVIAGDATNPQALQVMAGSGNAYAGAFQNNSATTGGGVLSLDSNSLTSASMLRLYHSSSSFSGNGIFANFASSSGSFSGKFVNFQVNGSSVFDINSSGGVYAAGSVGIGTTTPTAGKLVIAQTDAANLQALTIDTEESTGTQNVFSVISDSGSDENTVLNLTAAGNLSIDGSLTTGGASTVYADGSITKSSGSAMSVVLGGAAGDDFIVDTNTLVVKSDNDRVGIGTASPSHTFTVNTASGSPFKVISTFNTSSMNTFEIQTARTDDGGTCILCISGAGGADWEYRFIGNGQAYADGAWNGGGADVAEWTSTKDKTLESGDILIIDGSSSESLVKKSADVLYDSRLIGIVSTNPGLVSGAGEAEKQHGLEYGDVLTALVGRVPVKVSLENGPIAVGNRITSSSVPGVGMKTTKEGTTVGIALESLNSESQYEEGKNYGKILVFINLGWNYLDSSAVLAASSENSTTNYSLPTTNSQYWLINSNGRLTSTVDLDLDGKSIYNIGGLFGKSGKWTLSESGYLEVEKLIVKEAEIKKVKIGAYDLPAGITIYDEDTGEPYCIKVKSGQMINIPEECDNAPISTNTEPIDTNLEASLPSDESVPEPELTAEPEQAAEEQPAEPDLEATLPSDENTPINTNTEPTAEQPAESGQ